MLLPGHAASIGQVDPEDMYYLMSRGLDKATAERLVVRSFLWIRYRWDSSQKFVMKWLQLSKKNWSKR